MSSTSRMKLLGSKSLIYRILNAVGVGAVGADDAAAVLLALEVAD